MKRLLIFLLLALSATSLFPQSAEKADRFFSEGLYSEAGAIYRQLLVRSSQFPLYNYRYARCLQEQGQYDEAIRYFAKSGEKYVLKYFFLGEIYASLWRFDEALTAYTTYLEKAPQPCDREDYTRYQIDRLQRLRRYAKHIEKVTLIDTLTLPLDSLYAFIPLSAEGGSLTPGEYGHIYTNQRGDRRLWGQFTDSVVALSTRHHLLDDWTAPQLLPANLQLGADQRNPYLLTDGVTLYFASRNPDGIGGFDIYITRYNTASESYTTPENLGFPYNSEANDYFLIIDEFRHLGYLASDRNCAPGQVRLYRFIPQERKSYWRLDALTPDSLQSLANLTYALPLDSTTLISLTPPPSPLTPHPSPLTTHPSPLTTPPSPLTTHPSPSRSEIPPSPQSQIENREPREALKQLRALYLASDSATRVTLRDTILTLESELLNQ